MELDSLVLEHGSVTGHNGHVSQLELDPSQIHSIIGLARVHFPLELDSLRLKHVLHNKTQWTRIPIETRPRSNPSRTGLALVVQFQKTRPK